MVYWGWFVNGGWVIYWDWLMDWSWGMVSWGWFVDRSWVVYWGRLVNWTWGSISFIGNIGNISSVMISSVFYVLTSSVRKYNTVMSIDSLSIRGFSGINVSSSVLILDTIGIFVWSGFVDWLMVGWSWVVSWLRSMVCWRTSWSSTGGSKKERCDDETNHDEIEIVFFSCC